MLFGPLPPSGAWQHVDSRVGLEVAYLEDASGGHRLHGCTTALEQGEPWWVTYEIVCDVDWRTRRAHIAGTSTAGTRSVLLETDGRGTWRINGSTEPALAGCLDVDLESSALTNTLPVHRLALTLGETRPAPAAYVRATGLTVHRLEQTYGRHADDGCRQRYHYTAPAFDFAAQLVYDEAGLILDYPGIARRVG
jgi:hypothetical protein